MRSPPPASRGSRVRRERPRSRTIAPSARNSTRSAIAAACASWVTITVVWPNSSTDSRSSARISPLVRRVEVAGRLVGEHHLGRETSARATATRCCWPPDSSDGRCDSRSREADRCRSARRPTPGPACRRRARAAAAMFSAAVSIGSRLKNWKMNPMCSRRSFVSCVVARPRDLGARDRRPAARWTVEAGEDVHQRRLARAGRPHHGRQLTARDRRPDTPRRA